MLIQSMIASESDCALRLILANDSVKKTVAVRIKMLSELGYGGVEC